MERWSVELRLRSGKAEARRTDLVAATFCCAAALSVLSRGVSVPPYAITPG